MKKDNIQGKKRKPIGCFVLIFLFAALITGVTQNLEKTTEKSKIENQKDLIVLKDETFLIYEDIYKININMRKGLESVSDGTLNIVDYHDFLKKIKKHSLNRVKYLEQKSKELKDDEIVEDLKPYLAVYTKLLMISDNMINNLENPSLEVLSKTKKLVEEVTILIKHIEDERLNLLIHLGIDENEIEEILKNENEKMDVIKEGN